MSNYWMIPRAKRTLVSLPLVLSVVSATALGKEWSSRDVTLALEGMLEKYQIKRTGKRRDQSGGGGRTYRAWLEALGFIFKEDESGLFRLTKAGEKLQKGEETIRTVTNQLMKMQYPSVYSIKPMVDVSRRFRVHPFRFLLSLLASQDIKYLTEEEIALFAVTEGESDDDKCLEKVKNEILHFRADKNSLVLDATFAAKHGSRNGARSIVKTISSLKDIANTFINYLEYTQLAGRDEEGRLGILKTKEVQDILERPAFFNRHDPNASPESFQRAFGLGPEDIRDDRKFEGENVNADNISRQLVNTAFLYRANFHLVDVNNQAIVESIAKETGVPKKDVANYLKVFSGKERDILSAAYVGMAFAGQDEATNFEIATAELLGQAGLGFHAEHVAAPGKNKPDIHFSESVVDGATGIVDAKAYAAYSITNDHFNRMLHNYIPDYRKSDGEKLQLFMYVAGGFKRTFEAKLRELASQAGLIGLGILAQSLLEIVYWAQSHPDRKPLIRNKIINFPESKVVFMDDFIEES